MPHKVYEKVCVDSGRDPEEGTLLASKGLSGAESGMWGYAWTIYAI